MRKSSNRLKDRDTWYKLKKYPHIGLQLEPRDRAWVEPYVNTKINIEKHAFYPFVHRQLKARKFRREINKDGTRSALRNLRFKRREIFYSNHLDSNIYSFYAEIISNKYELAVRKIGISNCITAYRRLLSDPSNPKSRYKCNIDFASEVFTFIKQCKQKNLVAITFDIKSFFDNLNHKFLKKSWRKLLDSGNDLPPDHYNVYRSITKFSYVDEGDIFELFKDKIVVERKPNIKKEVKIHHKSYLREKRAIAYCFKEDMALLRSKNLIKSNKYFFENGTRGSLRDKGIPQGSPISAVLANIYMMEFDKSANDLIEGLGGLYRRYSDDMVVVCNVEFEETIIEHFQQSIANCFLEFQQEKLHVFHFKYDNDRGVHVCYEKNLNSKQLQSNTNFTYLGFEFDGYFALLKSSSLSGFYRKMKRSIAKGRFYAFHNKTSTWGVLFKSRLYKRFTYLGSHRRRTYKRDPKKSDRFILSNKYYWGNFLTYAILASKTIPDNKIPNQIKRHWNKFHFLIKSIENP